MGNDANVAALGEFRFGAGKAVRNMVMVTLGTGIGGGIILDGKLWTGATGESPEWRRLRAAAQQYGVRIRELRRQPPFRFASNRIN